MEQTLDSYLEEHLGITAKHPNYNAIYAATVRYVASGYSSIKDYHNALSRLLDFSEYEFSAADFRIKLSTVFRFVVKMRFFVLTVCLSKKPERDIKRYQEYGLTKREAVLAWNHMLRQPALRVAILKAAKGRHRELCRDLVSTTELRRRIRETQSLFNDLTRATKYQTRSKLRWVSIAHNITLEDLSAELMCQVLVSYYQSLPNAFTDLYQLNYLKASLTNRVNNMNNMYGAQKRRRMEKTGADTYSLIVVSDNQIMHTGNGEDEVNYESLGELHGTSALPDKLETQVTIERIMDVPKGTKRHALHSTLLGHTTVQFTSFLRSENQCKPDESSVEWMSRKNVDHVVRYLARWLRVAEAEVAATIYNIRSAF